jgi:hypothetical protein
MFCPTVLSQLYMADAGHELMSNCGRCKMLLTATVRLSTEAWSAQPPLASGKMTLNGASASVWQL